MKPAARERLEEFKRHIEHLNTPSSLYEWVQPENVETPYKESSDMLGSPTPSSPLLSKKYGLYGAGRRTPSIASASTSSSLPASPRVPSHSAFHKMEEGLKSQLSSIWESILFRINKALNTDNPLPFLRDIFLYIDSNSDLDLFYPERDPAYEELQLLPNPLRDKIRDELDECIKNLFISSEASDFIEESEHPKKHEWLSYYISEQKKFQELIENEEEIYQKTFAESSIEDDDDKTSPVLKTDPIVVERWARSRKESLRIMKSAGDPRPGILMSALGTIK